MNKWGEEHGRGGENEQIREREREGKKGKVGERKYVKRE